MQALRAPFAALATIVGRNRVSSAVFVVLLAALVSGSLGLWESPVRLKGGNIPPATATESFVRGQADFNAKLMWNALSEDFTQALAMQGQEVETIQGQLDSLKDSGVRYTEIKYVGGYKSKAGEGFYLYIFSRKNPERPEGTESVPYLFVLDRTGKIQSIQ